MSSPKFKVGDVVRVMKGPGASYVGTITSSRAGVFFVDGLPYPGVLTDELELVTPSLPDATGTSVPDGLAPAPAVTKPQPTEAQKRKAQPVASGVLAYFPRALKYVAEVSKKGNDQHNPGQPLHWDKSKSTDHADCLVRHLLDHLEGVPVDTDGMRHLGKVVWRALALLEVELEKEASK